MKRPQITTAEALAALDPAEILEGYRDGRAGDPEPGDNRSDAYWHGWTKGAFDGGHREKTAADIALARSVCASP